MGPGGPSPGEGAVAEKIKDSLKRYCGGSMLRTMRNVAHGTLKQVRKIKDSLKRYCGGSMLRAMRNMSHMEHLNRLCLPLGATPNSSVRSSSIAT